MWGTSGSGKTLLLAEALKMKISQLKREGKQVRVIISAMTNTEFLMKDLEAKYLPDLAGDDNARFISLPDLARELKCEHDTAHPQLYIEKILSSLSSQHSSSSPHTILLVDEVNPMSKDEKEKDSCTADWSELTNRDGVDCLISLQTYTDSRSLFNVVPPHNKHIVGQRLLTPHRNCAKIGTFLKYTIHHTGGAYLTTEDDQQAKHLPPGRPPVWVERVREVTDDQVLDFINENFLDEIKGGTVLHQQGNPSGAAARWCTSNSGWRYVEAPKMVGSEDQQVVLMDVGLAPEYLSRGRNLLVIVTTRGKER